MPTKRAPWGRSVQFVLAAAIWFALLIWATAHAATINLPAGQALYGAMKAAQPCDVIQLAPGAYPFTSAYGAAYDKAGACPVTIQGPREAVLGGLVIQSAGGYRIQGVTLQAGAKPGLQILSAHDVALDGVLATQQPGATPDQVRGLWAIGVKVTSSSRVVIRNSEFAWVGFGIAHQGADGLLVADSSFHDISNDGVRGNSSGVQILRNSFTNFYAATQADGARVHFDAIQFFTNGRTTPVDGVTLADNRLLRGTGDTMSNLQLGDEADRTAWPWPGVKVGYTNLRIFGNLFAGGGNFGAEGTIEADIHDNLIAGTVADAHPTLDPKTGLLVETGYAPRFVLSHGIGGSVHDNGGPYAPQFYQPLRAGAVVNNIVDPLLIAPAGDYGRPTLWWFGRRTARLAP